ncbi:MAG TPA: MBL fold metallo-hydrolase [Chloroflexota bacterium]|jgi:glyoxylase-like metal-dependent hydrolase (beta-lactamase superfamily II)|nr:MBL fold metallo-hydrolase [Chloroflexota bacterium]
MAAVDDAHQTFTTGCVQWLAVTMTPRPLPHIVEVAAPELDSRVRIFRCGRLVDSWAILTERFVVVVDTMISPETASQIMAFLRLEQAAHPQRQLLVINTHGDWDHCWGNGIFDGPDAPYRAPIIGHEATRRLFQADSAEAWLRESRLANLGWYDSVRLVLPSIEFEKRLVIDGGDLALHLIPTPGHTADHVVVWIPEISLLMAADAAELPMPFIGERSNLDDLRRSLTLMLDLQAEVVLYAHGADIRSPSLIRHNIWYFEEAARRCRTALAAGCAPDDTSPTSLAWPMEAIMPVGMTFDDYETVEFYRNAHTRAVKAVANHVCHPGHKATLKI